MNAFNYSGYASKIAQYFERNPTKWDPACAPITRRFVNLVNENTASYEDRKKFLVEVKRIEESINGTAWYEFVMMVSCWVKENRDAENRMRSVEAR